MVSAGIYFLIGWFAYHFLMNRAVMMRECCVKHFRTHDTCACIDCKQERDSASDHRRR